jgi:hypothetical protein
MIQRMKAEIAALKAAVAALTNVTIEGYSKSVGKGGIAFVSGSPGSPSIPAGMRTVVITKKPQPTDATLVVREAKYDDWPPQKCEGTPRVCHYEWYGDDFEVWPPLGKEAVSFDGDEWDGDTDPKLDTKFHRVHREHDVWVIEAAAEGGAEIVMVKIVDSIPVNAPSSKFLTVQKMKVDEIAGSPTFGQWLPDGVTESAECWPNYVAAHYLPMRFQIPEVIVPMTKTNGTQYVWQKNRIGLGQPLSSLPASDCVVPLRP